MTRWPSMLSSATRLQLLITSVHGWRRKGCQAANIVISAMQPCMRNELSAGRSACASVQCDPIFNADHVIIFPLRIGGSRDAERKSVPCMLMHASTAYERHILAEQNSAAHPMCIYMMPYATRRVSSCSVCEK